jgi:hypothetical protein
VASADGQSTAAAATTPGAPPGRLPIRSAGLAWLAGAIGANVLGYVVADRSGGHGMGALFSGLGALTLWVLAALLVPPAAVVAAEVRHRKRLERVGLTVAVLLLGLPIWWLVAAFGVAFALWAESLWVLLPLTAAVSAFLAWALREWLYWPAAVKVVSPGDAEMLVQASSPTTREPVPRPVRLGLALLCAAVALQALTIVLLAIARPLPSEHLAPLLRLPIPAALIVTLVQRRRWARWAYLALYFVGAFSMLGFPYGSIPKGPWAQLSVLVQEAAQLLGLVLLLAPAASRRWFAASRAEQGMALARQPG